MSLYVEGPVDQMIPFLQYHFLTQQDEALYLPLLLVALLDRLGRLGLRGGERQVVDLLQGG